jgi:hypothetical protein
MWCSSLVSLFALVGIFTPYSPLFEKLSFLEKQVKEKRENFLSCGEKLIREKKWEALKDEIQRDLQERSITFDDLDALSKLYPASPFSLALQAAKSILSLRDTGLDFQTIFPICLFAETRLSDEVQQKKCYFSEERFGRELQYDRETKKFFIHLGTHGVDPIGKGSKKIVTKTILYDRHHPVVMARGVTDANIKREMEAMHALRGLPCLLNAEAMMIHIDEKDKWPLMTIVTPIYKPGSLQKLIRNRSIHLSFKEKLKIASDIMTGVHSIHAKGYAHRDLGARNYFVHISSQKGEKRTVSAVVADMEKARLASTISSRKVQGNCAYLSPEGFFPDKMHGNDYIQSDLFAVGCVLWQIYFKKLTPWGKQRFLQDDSLSIQERCDAHLSFLEKTRKPLLEELAEKRNSGKNMRRKDLFLEIILQLTDPIPAHRGTALQARDRLVILLNKK